MKANNGANVLDAIIGNAGTKTPHDVAVEAKITEASARVAALLSDMSAEKLCAYMAESFERAAFVAITSANTSIGASVQMAPNVATSLVPPKLAADQVRDAAKSVARADELSRTAVEWRKLEATFKSLLPNGGTIAVTV